MWLICILKPADQLRLQPASSKAHFEGWLYTVKIAVISLKFEQGDFTIE